MVATTHVVMMLAFFGTRGEQARTQKEAVAAIEKLGGNVMYDYQLAKPPKPNVFEPHAPPKATQYLRERLGDDFFRVVVFVNLRDTKARDDDLRCLTKLSGLLNLDLTGTQITGAGLTHIKDLRELRYLSLWKTAVEDAGLKHLTRLRKLCALVLDETKVTDAGLEHLAGLTELEEWLGLSRLQVTDEGLKHLTNLKKLRNLTLRLTEVTAQGAKKLKESLPKTDIAFGQ